MSLLKPLESVPLFGGGVKWFDTQMHNSLFQHSVFGAIVFLVVSNTGVYKIVKDIICDVTGYKADGNTMQLIHAVVFAVIMYFGSLFILAPLLTEGKSPEAKPPNKDIKSQGGSGGNGNHVRNSCRPGERVVRTRRDGKKVCAPVPGFIPSGDGGKSGGGDSAGNDAPGSNDMPPPVTSSETAVIDLTRRETQKIANVESAMQVCGSDGSINMNVPVPAYDGRFGRVNRPTKRDRLMAIMGADSQFQSHMGEGGVVSQYGVQIHSGTGGNSGGRVITDQAFTKCDPIEGALVLGLLQTDVVHQLYTTVSNMGNATTNKVSSVGGNSNFILYFSRSQQPPDPINGRDWYVIPSENIPDFMQHTFFAGEIGQKNVSEYLNQYPDKDVQDFFDIAAINSGSQDIYLYVCNYIPTRTLSTFDSTTSGVTISLTPGL